MFSFERDRECEWGGVEREREGDTESEAGFRLRAVGTEPDTGLKPTNGEITISELKSDAQPTEPPRRPSNTLK